MASSRNSNYRNLDDKVAAIRAGKRKDSLDVGEAIKLTCQNHKNRSSGNFEPISLATLSKLSESGRTTYITDAIKDINRGRSTTLSKNCAAFMANMTGKDIAFWQRNHYTLAEAESIQITLPHEIKPEPTIAGPATHSQGITSLPTPPDLDKMSAREFLMAQLFPADLTSTTIARHMKGNGGIER